MKQKNFKNLLQQIENNTFIGNKIRISGEGQEERVRVPHALDDNKVILLTNALKKNPDIKIIDLFCNNIEDEGAIALAKVNTLEELSLYDNRIGIKGSIALAN